MSVSIASTLMEIIATAQQELGKMGHAAGSTKKATKQVKESTRKGRPTPHGDFTKKILEDHKAEKDAFIAARVAKAAAGELLYEANDSAVKKGKHQVGDAYSEDDAKKGAHLNFIAVYKSQHMDEYKAFETSWREAHPKENDTEAVVESETESVTPVTTNTTTKPKRVMTDDQKAKMKAGRERTAAAKKAEKNATDQAMKEEFPLATGVVATPVVATPVVAAPVVTAPVVAVPVVAAPVVAAPVVKKATKQAKKATAPVPAPAPAPVTNTTDDEPELLPFKYAGANYLRIGISRSDNNHLWVTGDLWASNKGNKGTYIGCLSADSKSIDRNAVEPEVE